MIKGYDVSVYQPINFPTDGDFVIIKVTEGTSYVNPKWVNQLAVARKAGMAVGFYHYPHITNDPIAEANHFMGQLHLIEGDFVVLDWEWYGQSVSDARARVYKKTWLDYVRQKLAGHRTLLYANVEAWTKVDQDSYCADGLWIADPNHPAGSPGIKDHWVMHQYSTANDIDHDVANFSTKADMMAWLKFDLEEDSMAGITKQDIFEAVWETDAVTPPAGAATKDNPKWVPISLLSDIANNVRSLKVTEAAQSAAIAKLAQLIGSDVNTDEVVKAVQQAIADAVVKVSVNVTQPPVTSA